MAIVEPVESSGPRRRLRVRSPVTLEPIGEFDCASDDDVRAAVERARKAQAERSTLSFDRRARHLSRLVDELVARQDENSSEWALDEEATEGKREEIREQRKQRGIPFREWWQQEREKILAREDMSEVQQSLEACAESDAEGDWVKV